MITPMRLLFPIHASIMWSMDRVNCWDNALKSLSEETICMLRTAQMAVTKQSLSVQPGSLFGSICNAGSQGIGFQHLDATAERQQAVAGFVDPAKIQG